MNFLTRIFNRKTAAAATRTRLIQENNGTFSGFSGNVYENDIFRAGVDAIARNCGKLKGSHIVTGADGRAEGDSRINKILQIRPNKYMSAYDFIYKMVTHLFIDNNAFALLSFDARGQLDSIYPITATSVQVLRDDRGSLYCAFTTPDGSKYTFDYNSLIHLRRFYNSNDILGDGNAAIRPGLELAQAQNDGIINGIKSGASIRGILQYSQVMAPAQLKKEKDRFIADYLDFSNNGGVVAVDQKATYTPIESHPVTVSADDMTAAKNKIYNYLGVTEAVVNSSYTEDEFAAFYESTIEPIAMALSQELTYKVFTEREIAFGNQIIFESGTIQFTSNKTKINLISNLLPYGVLTVNQALEILNLPSVPDGDKRLQALNMIDAKKALKYQVGEEGNQDEGKKDSQDRSQK